MGEAGAVALSSFLALAGFSGRPTASQVLEDAEVRENAQTLVKALLEQPHLQAAACTLQMSICTLEVSTGYRYSA